MLNKDEFKHHKVRKLFPGLGDAVFNRTYKRDNETWEDLSYRVVQGNTGLDQNVSEEELEIGLRLTKKGACLWSGRHLQHGDDQQASKSLDLFSNCATSGTSFIMYYLLLCGAGVGRLYDSDVILTDWSKLPKIHNIMDDKHPDYEDCKPFLFTDKLPRDLLKKYSIEKLTTKDNILFTVGDSRVEIAKAVEFLETLAYRAFKDKNFVMPKAIFFEHSFIRKKGDPIKSVQSKPAPGPKPFIEAIFEVDTYIQSCKGLATTPAYWLQTITIDDILAHSVLAGGSRRSSRIACKSWTEEDILDFVHLKNGGGYQTANNSVLVTKDFWKGIREGASKATEVFNEVMNNAYGAGTGEPAFINQDLLEENRDGLEKMTPDNIINQSIFSLSEDSKSLYADLIGISLTRKYIMIVNPCSEINLHFLCGYCVIFDLALSNCETFTETREAGIFAGRALIRANTMSAIYDFEVKRTNRIGIGLTGMFDYAFRYGNQSFSRLVDYNWSAGFWDDLQALRNHIKQDIIEQCRINGLPIPHTMFTIKPSGSVSKLFGLCEGAHLPSMRQYIRWVAMTQDDPLVAQYKEAGYPIKELKTYKNTTIVGFPTELPITQVTQLEDLPAAGDASPEDQYKWISLIEKYWLGKEHGGQVSYSLKFNPAKVSFEQFKQAVLEYHSNIKCCSWMPQVDLVQYEYLPEEAVDKETFDAICSKITNKNIDEQIDMALLECQNGYCPL